MSICELKVSEFRNIEGLTIKPAKNINLIAGANGSGKTSILEALYYLSHGRSFRTNNYSKVINYESDGFTVFGRIELADQDYTRALGLQRFRSGELKLRINGEESKRISDLARELPVQIITPESFSFFTGGPKERRKFCDLGLFHVKHGFHETWVRFNKVLKHRNALLKRRPSSYNREFDYWDIEFCRLAEIMDSLRQSYAIALNEKLTEVISHCDFFDSDILIHYYPGWNKESDLKELLMRSFERDVKQGYTSSGPHKSDIKLKSGNVDVSDSFSRGQLKLLLYAVKVAQNQLISEVGKAPMMLIDDLTSEIDNDNLKKVARLIQLSSAQHFVTSISLDSASIFEGDSADIAMFHVKHGGIT